MDEIDAGLKVSKDNTVIESLSFRLLENGLLVESESNSEQPRRYFVEHPIRFFTKTVTIPPVFYLTVSQYVFKSKEL